MMTEAKNRYEVSSDGKTVWVNGVGCVARFGKVTHEIYSDVMVVPAFLHSKAHMDGIPTMSDWLDFVDRVFDAYKVAVEDKHRPAFILCDD